MRNMLPTPSKRYFAETKPGELLTKSCVLKVPLIGTIKLDPTTEPT